MERCADSSCGYENRLEYCETEAGDPEGNVSYVIQSLDELLYDNNQIASDMYMASISSDGRVINRTFSITHFDSRGWILPLTTSTIAIKHSVGRRLNTEAYEVQLDWSVEQLDQSSEPYRVNYTIDLYTHGTVQALIEQPDFAGGGRTVSPLSSYDYEALYNVLSLFAVAQRAEREDNQRILKAA